MPGVSFGLLMRNESERRGGDVQPACHEFASSMDHSETKATHKPMKPNNRCGRVNPVINCRQVRAESLQNEPQDFQNDPEYQVDHADHQARDQGDAQGDDSQQHP